LHVGDDLQQSDIGTLEFTKTLRNHKRRQSLPNGLYVEFSVPTLTFSASRFSAGPTVIRLVGTMEILPHPNFGNLAMV
jgi:hypothetical protein